MMGWEGVIEGWLPQMGKEEGKQLQTGYEKPMREGQEVRSWARMDFALAESGRSREAVTGELATGR